MIIESDKVVFYDVDDTLITWNSSEELEDDVITLTDAMGDITEHKVLRKNVISLIEHSKRGHKIVVWSAGGYAWASQAVKLLGLEKYVDLVVSKPTWWYDDLTAEEVLLPSNRRFNRE